MIECGWRFFLAIQPVQACRWIGHIHSSHPFQFLRFWSCCGMDNLCFALSSLPDTYLLYSYMLSLLKYSLTNPFTPLNEWSIFLYVFSYCSFSYVCFLSLSPKQPHYLSSTAMANGFCIPYRACSCKCQYTSRWKHCNYTRYTRALMVKVENLRNENCDNDN